MKSKIWTIIKHEYLLKVRTKGFIIGTLLSPLLILLFIGVMAGIQYFTATSEITDANILINDKTGLIASDIIAIDSKQYKTTILNEDSLRQLVLNSEINAAIILPADLISNNTSAVILTNSESGSQFISQLEDNIDNAVKQRKLQAENISQSTIDLINSSVSFDTKIITTKGEVEDNSSIKVVLSYIMGFAMYMLMFMYGSFVMQGVLEEKTNRIVEVLASSVTPFQIMFGKVVGIGAVGITQVILWIILGAGVLFGISNIAFSPELANDIINSTNQMNIQAQISNTSNDMTSSEMMSIVNSINSVDISIIDILLFMFYFISGYFIFATLFAAAASTVDSMQETNNLSTPLSMLIIIPILLISNIVMQPEGNVAIVASLFPFFSPILMTARIIAISVPFWQLALSIVLQIVTFLISLKLAGKIYRIGMLRYGKKANWKDIILWIRTK